eukprot:TRINITY_DN59427_c0_g1_i2.p1 TRINITY_DN59427_c0_g1~~TRINITY_DN59427_c0_g1_i2.p1  ORF type:complete len:482 (-),score=59.18 TRINITY_DN59427_c0_g1_i2:1911-3356(-)
MGNTLPRAVTCKVIDRGGNKNFKAAVCSMNGFREQMEDAHAIKVTDEWGYFGVFDGHSGSKCSSFCSKRFPEEIEKAPKPVPDDELEKITLAIDAEFIGNTKESGSTATMFVATKGKEAGTYDIQVGNVGDSRVIIVKDGECVSMTTDHKPSLEKEKERIERCGGTVHTDRVDGMLAMSRAMGDSEYKNREGSQLEQKVIPQPDVTHGTCGPKDYVLVCCDGIFESNFSNEQVVEFVNQQLKDSPDIAAAMCNLCEEALARGSTDNMTAMLVQFTDGSTYGPQTEFLPGPIHPHKGFTTAYKAMAERAGLTYGHALEMRYDQIRELMSSRADELKNDDSSSGAQTGKGGKGKQAVGKQGKGKGKGKQKEPEPEKPEKNKGKGGNAQKGGRREPDEKLQALREELSKFHIGNEKGPDKKATPEERTSWFEKFAQDSTSAESSDSQAPTLETLQEHMQGGTIPLSMLFRLAGVNTKEEPDGKK